MRDRFSFGIGVAFFLLAVDANDAAAHRLDAQITVLPASKVQVESWFSNGDVPRGAKVEIFDASGQPLQTGTLDDKGAFSFVTDAAHAMRVVVSAGAGHRKELSISETQLAPASADGPVRVSTRETGAPMRDVLSGLAFLLGLGAFVISVRNAQKLRNLARTKGVATTVSS
jgi:hypothetical protein